MNRSFLLNLLYSYSPFNDCEKVSYLKMIDFIKKNHLCFERTNQEGHITVSVWLLNNTLDKTLFTHHKKFNLWLQLGGHADGDSDVYNVALKEVSEESGLTDLLFLLDSHIFDIDVHEIPASGDVPFHYHYDVRFLMYTTQKESDIVISGESNDLRWFGFDDPQFPKSSLSLTRMHMKWKKWLSIVI
jgi:8-oxo-dGTP pyrophosphatase MutT (NUDIX family)